MVGGREGARGRSRKGIRMRGESRGRGRGGRAPPGARVHWPPPAPPGARAAPSCPRQARRLGAGLLQGPKGSAGARRAPVRRPHPHPTHGRPRPEPPLV